MIPCPRCQQAELAPRPIGFTWWGGVVGAKLLHHVECVRCATRYNGRSGRSNDGATPGGVVKVDRHDTT